MKKVKRSFKEKHPVLYEVLDYINVFEYIRENPWEFFLQVITTVIVSFISTVIFAFIKVYRGW